MKKTETVSNVESVLENGIANSELRETIFAVFEEYEKMKIELDMLRASNFELMQANEEFHNLNSEFHLVNLALKSKLESEEEKYKKIKKDYMDLQALVSLNNMAALFVDKAYQITRCTDNIGQILPDAKRKIGKSVNVLSQVLKVDNLEDYIDEVLDTLKKKRIKTISRDGRDYVVRISYFEDQKQRIEEAIIGFTEQPQC